MTPAKGDLVHINGNPECILPSFWKTITMNNAIRKQIGDFKKILTIRPENGTKTGENYTSLILRINIEVEMLDESVKTTTFLLKAQHNNEMMANVLSMLKLFPKEEEMYHRILPKFEELYRNVGKTVEFAPKAYKFDRDIGVDYILLEDLNERQYKNVNRLHGLDMCHMKAVLIKLAEFHAASACYVGRYGGYDEEFTISIFNESNRNLLKEFNQSSVFLDQLKKWKNLQAIYQKLWDSDDYLVERLLENQKVNRSEFNVLNHGDCWTNNILFGYEENGNLVDTRFIDFQVGKYGSPANDLYYLIMSSAAMDIKLNNFDGMIRFYYDHLIENLQLLQYHLPLPKLRNLHASLLRNGLAAYLVVSKVLPVVMLESTDNANLENFIENESKMKLAMYTNHKYVKAISEILPWLDNRGLLDWK